MNIGGTLMPDPPDAGGGRILGKGETAVAGDEMWDPIREEWVPLDQTRDVDTDYHTKRIWFRRGALILNKKWNDEGVPVRAAKPFTDQYGHSVCVGQTGVAHCIRSGHMFVTLDGFEEEKARLNEFIRTKGLPAHVEPWTMCVPEDVFEVVSK